MMGKILSRITRFAPVSLLPIALLWAAATNIHAETGFVGDQKVEVKRISQGRFVYPRAALRREIEGLVKIQVTLGETGRVVDAFVLEASPPNRFEKNALKFVRSLAYEPYLLNGVPQRVERVIVPVRYELQRVASR
jgi:TonB family protein